MSSQDKDQDLEVRVTDVSFLNENLWLGMRRWTWVKIAFAFIVFMGAYGLWQVQEINRRDQEQLQKLTENIAYQTCTRSNETRGVVREVVRLSTESPGIDLTRVPGFDDLDLSMQVFLMNLREASSTNSTDSPDSFRNRALGILQDKDCEAELELLISQGLLENGSGRR